MAEVVGQACVARLDMAIVRSLTSDEVDFVAEHPMAEHRARWIVDSFARSARRRAEGLGF
ncbi:MAG: hypothetical protein AAFZ07_03985 [Actinomycetota bacterium]